VEVVGELRPFDIDSTMLLTHLFRFGEYRSRLEVGVRDIAPMEDICIGEDGGKVDVSST
jgi:hypothetical protein